MYSMVITIVPSKPVGKESNLVVTISLIGTKQVTPPRPPSRQFGEHKNASSSYCITFHRWCRWTIGFSYWISIMIRIMTDGIKGNHLAVIKGLSFQGLISSTTWIPDLVSSEHLGKSLPILTTHSLGIQMSHTQVRILPTEQLKIPLSPHYMNFKIRFFF